MTRQPPGPCPLCGGARAVVVQTTVRATGLGASLQVDAVGPLSIPSRVFVASPYAGDIARNERYARACMADSLARGEAPFVPHLLYTQVLPEDGGEGRRRGLEAAKAMLGGCELLAVYEDLGVSDGMAGEIVAAEALGLAVERRRIGWVEAEAAAREGRCNRCGWPLRERIEDGCTPGNCSMRPLPPEQWPAKER